MTSLRSILALLLSLGMISIAADAAAKPSKKNPTSQPRSAPELAANGAPAALALIFAGAAVVASRRRRVD